MKILTPVFVLFFFLQSFAQTYPFAEGFEGMPNSQPPTGWAGSMKVLSNHGINDYKAVCARVSSGVTLDSTITPLIGQLTSASVLSFQYRIIDQANYPSTPTNLDDGDSITISISTDGINYHTVFLIDGITHFATFNFLKKKVYLSQYAGSNANFKIRCYYGTGTSFFVDIDTVVVRDEPQTAIQDVESNSSFNLYPNPCNQFAVCNLQFANSTAQKIKVFNCIGEEIYSTLSVANCLLPTANWLPGLYFVQLGNTTRKLIIQ